MEHNICLCVSVNTPKKMENFYRNFFYTKKQQQPQAQFNLILFPKEKLKRKLLRKVHQIIA